MTEIPTVGTLDTTFVGREREVTEVGAGLAEARRGAGGLYLIRGEAGIGKTRLAEELARAAAQRGETIYWGRCVEGGGAPAFWPWTQVLRALVAASQGPDPATHAERASIARLTQETPTDAAGAAEADEASPAQSWALAETARFQLFETIADFLQRAARQAPFGVVLDDLHAADLPSLLLLQHVARLAEARFWIVGTYREVEAHLDPQRGEAIATVARLGHCFTLSGLAQADVARVIEHALGAAPPPALVRQVAELTDGNPFFVDEVARLLWRQSAPEPGRTPARLPLPLSVRDVLRQRMRLLSNDCRQMLQAAAVAGREVSFTLLREVTTTEAPRLLDLIEEAYGLGILTARPGRRYAFAHALTRETLYDDLGASTRVALHGVVGSALERLHPAHLEEHLTELAYHFARVAPVGDAEKAVHYAERAARRAAAALAYEDAAELFRLALESLPLLGDHDSASRLIDLLLGLADACVRAGDTPHARAAFEQAAAVARTRGDYARFALAALGCGGVGLGVPQGTVDRALVHLLEEALAPPRDSYPASLRARLLARLALELYFSDAAARRTALMREAGELAATADAATRATVSHAHLVGLWDVTPPADRLRWSNELIALAESLGDDDLALRGHSYRLLEIIDTGIPDGWEAELDVITALGERLREPRFRGMIIGTRAMHSVWLGRFAEADALGAHALEIAQSVEDLHTEISIAAQAFFMMRLRGEADDVEACARAIFTRAPAIPGARCMMVLALCGLGRIEEARVEIEPLGDGDFDTLRRANRIASLVPWLAESAVMLGDHARMQSLSRDLQPLVERNITLQARVCFGPAAYYLGLIAAALGQPDAALVHFASARALAARLRGRPLLALIDTAEAQVLLSTGAAAAAHEVLHRARTTTTALGMHAITRRIDALLAGTDPSARRAGVATVHASGNGTGSAPGAQCASLRRDGSLWTIAAGHTVLRCKHSKGLQYLAHLLRHPGKSFHAGELVALDEHEPQESSTRPARERERFGTRVGPPQIGEPIADAKALSAYRARLEDLSTELAEATQFNDLARRDRLQEEIEVLTQALLGAVGFGGRVRTTGSFVERARLNVTRALRSAIRRIGEGHPDLERHLDRAVRTGTFCSYQPASGEVLQWEL